ncbi:MAG TPA: DUF4956 domain-containing protein [Bacteroidales bacterium]|jgi:hypothetical protein|nr:MAG: hypothetical protein BWX77_00961 [Bacteroidetes bacterium ADurb.Bin090]HNZ80390.1 DUF4956 domain-containing protein [Bacteroidales bacterium]HOH23894.1 DUF4956 domain-containing protein [Bacteroidales bacterium]HPB36337.1 DUF4956 domain-containing protein [Bacteroidales bacterium]HPN47749.1 DUF4956 domain-containing protein [Bacteroidales bacterium]
MDEFAEMLKAEELLEAQSMVTPIFNSHDLWELLFRFLFNFVVIGIIIHFFYYRKSRRVDYYFTFIIISVSIFFLIYLLGSVKLKIGFALGIFAIFGIIRYRTEQVPIREMTYLFTITAISVINALSIQMSYTQMVATNLVIILVIWGLETSRWLKHTNSKMVLYDRIQLILPEREKELIDDLKKRTGLDIIRVEVGHIDFSRDVAFIKVYYESDKVEINATDQITRFPKWSNQ